jgi:hypothetical protein
MTIRVYSESIRVRHVVIGEEFILLRGIQLEIPLLLLFGVLLGRKANPISIFKKKNQAKSIINNKKEEKKRENNEFILEINESTDRQWRKNSCRKEANQECQQTA